MFKRIATGDSGRPVVLSEFNDAETIAMEHILCLAKQNLDSRRLSKRERLITEIMIEEQCKAYGIEPIE